MSMNRKQAFKLLELKEGASSEEIKRAYKKKALEFHPDKNNGSLESEEKFKQINNAYQLLTAPDDRHSSELFSQVFDDLFGSFENFFHNGQAHNSFRQQQPSLSPLPNPATVPSPDLGNIDLGKVEVDIFKIMFAELFEFKLKVKAVCTDCLVEDNWKSCSRCKQLGKLLTSQGFFQTIKTCSTCSGLGWVRLKHCKKCKDNGIYIKEKNVSVKIPKNFQTGNRLQIHRCGNEHYKRENSSIFLSPVVTIPDFSGLDSNTKQKIRNA